MSTEKMQEVNLPPKMKIERQIIPVCLSVTYYAQEVDKHISKLHINIKNVDGLDRRWTQ